MSLRNYLLASGTFAAGTSAYVIAGLLPALAADLDVSLSAAGQLVTGFAVVYAIASPVLAAATGRWERRRLLVVALLVMALGNALAAVAPDYWTLFVSRMLTALGAAVYTPTATTVATELNPPERRARAIATIFGGLTIALVIGVPMGNLLAEPLGHQGVFALVAGLIALSALGVWLVVPRVDAPPPVSLRNRLSVLADRRLLAMLAVTLLATLATLSVYTYLTPLLAETAGAEGHTAGLLLLAYGVGGVLGNMIGGRVTDRFGSRGPLIVAMLGGVATMGLLPVIATSVPGAAAILLVWGAATWSFNPPMQSRLVEMSPNTAGLVLAMNASAIYLGVGLAGGAGALVISFSSTLALGPIAAATTVLALVLFVLQPALVRSER